MGRPKRATNILHESHNRALERNCLTVEVIVIVVIAGSTTAASK